MAQKLLEVSIHSEGKRGLRGDFLGVQSNLALREIFVTAYLSLKVKFLLKSSFRNIISEPYISPTEKRKPFFSLSLSFPTAFNLPNSQYMIIDKCILSKTTIGHPF